MVAVTLAPPLRPTALAALVTAAVPGVEPVSVHIWHVDDRRDHQVARVQDTAGRTWVVRSPLTPAAGAGLGRHDILLRLLAPHLPFAVPVAGGFTERPGVGRVGVYPFIEGAPLRLEALPPGRGLASALGRALAALHNTPLGVFEESGVPGYDPEGYRLRLLAHLDRTAESGHVPTSLLGRWEQALEHRPLWQFSPVGTHGGLDGSSVLAAFTEDDAASGRVTGLVGWESPQVADPADDLAFVAADSHPAALDAVIESYAMARSAPVDAHLALRAQLAAEMIGLHDLASAVESGDAERVTEHADALRRLDRYTSGSDPLVPQRLLVPAPTAAVVREEPGLGDADAVAEDAVGDDDATGEIGSPFMPVTRPPRGATAMSSTGSAGPAAEATEPTPSTESPDDGDACPETTRAMPLAGTARHPEWDREDISPDELTYDIPSSEDGDSGPDGTEGESGPTASAR